MQGGSQKYQCTYYILCHKCWTYSTRRRRRREGKEEGGFNYRNGETEKVVCNVLTFQRGGSSNARLPLPGSYQKAEVYSSGPNPNIIQLSKTINNFVVPNPLPMIPKFSTKFSRGCCCKTANLATLWPKKKGVTEICGFFLNLLPSLITWFTRSRRKLLLFYSSPFSPSIALAFFLLSLFERVGGYKRGEKEEEEEEEEEEKERSRVNTQTKRGFPGKGGMI